MNRRQTLKGAGSIFSIMAMAGGVNFMTLDTASAAITGPDGAPIPPGPVANRIAHNITQLGHTRTDYYHWLRADNWQAVLDEPSVLPANIRTHLVAENAYSDQVLKQPTTALRQALFEEMRAMIKEDDSTVPTPDGTFAYFTRFRQGGQYPVVVRTPIDPATKNASGPEQILIDGDEESKGEAFWRLLNWEQNPRHDIIAYMVDTEGARITTIKFKVAATGSNLPDVIHRASEELVWAKDGRTCFYVVMDENVRPIKIMRHEVGTSQDKDVLVYHETDPSWFLSVEKSSSGDYMFLSSSASEMSEIRVLDLSKPKEAPKLMVRRTAGLEYYPDHHGDYFYLRTNADGATDFKIMRTPVNALGKSHWRDYVPYQAGTLVENFRTFGSFLVRSEMVDALPRITIKKLDNGEEHAISFGEGAYDLDLSNQFEFDTNILRYAYNSPSTPTEVWDYDMTTHQRVLKKRTEIPSGHNPQDFIVERINVPSEGGVLVPVTLLRHKDTPKDGTAPCLLYGYGSYGISMAANWSNNRLPLVKRGLIYAIAHIRGGQERGYHWYLDGKLENKQHTFTDFITVARALGDMAIVAKGKIVIEGRSAGGLLVGACYNQAPELFAGVIGGVAFVDVINTISDETLPLTPPEWTEWGDPIRDRAAYDRMMAYSPYDNVAPRAYPPLFAQTALSDSQVTYWEPAKWVAKLRHEAPDAGPFLLNVNMEAGHGGASGRFDRLHEVADSHAFALWCLNKVSA